MSDEACRLAQNLARNVGYSVFPCRDDKSPATPHGFKDSSTDTEIVAQLWRRHPGPLIGVACGERSGISVLDVDTRHATACAWWRQNHRRIPPTTTYRTRSGGLHLLFRHAPGVRCCAGKPVQGVDARGEGGYVVFWFAAGFECLDHSPAAPWPAWLSDFFWPPAPRPREQQPTTTGSSADPVLDRAVAIIKAAGDGQKHFAVWRASRLLGGVMHRLKLSESAAIGKLIDALPDTPDDRDAGARKTAEDGLKAGRQQPIGAR